MTKNFKIRRNRNTYFLGFIQNYEHLLLVKLKFNKFLCVFTTSIITSMFSKAGAGLLSEVLTVLGEGDFVIIGVSVV